MIPSEELLEVQGHIMKRWQAEKIGLIPVVVHRCLRALSDEFGNSPPHYLFHGHDLPMLFRSSEYFKPIVESWDKGSDMIDTDGTACIGFWPYHLRKHEIY